MDSNEDENDISRSKEIVQRLHEKKSMIFDLIVFGKNWKLYFIKKCATPLFTKSNGAI